jgi:hypothetical protein
MRMPAVTVVCEFEAGRSRPIKLNRNRRSPSSEYGPIPTLTLKCAVEPDARCRNADMIAPNHNPRI